MLLAGVKEFGTQKPSDSVIKTQSLECPLCSRPVMIAINIKENWTKFCTLTSESEDERQQQQGQRLSKRKKSSTLEFSQEMLSLLEKSYSTTMKRLKVARERSDTNENSGQAIEEIKEEQNYDEDHEQLLPYTLVKCTSCDKSIGIICDDDSDNNNGWKAYSCDEILYNASHSENGWKMADGEKDTRAVFVLNQIIYKEYEMRKENESEVEFAFPESSDFIKLLWINGTASGYFSLKLKGTLNPNTMETYSLVTLDTIFIRSIHRRKGYASASVQNILSEFPEQNIGFSYPISTAMKKVLAKDMEIHPQHRKRLWEIAECGTQGNRRNVWLLLKKDRRQET